MSEMKDLDEKEFQHNLMQSFKNWKLESADAQWERIKNTLDEQADSESELNQVSNWNADAENELWTKIASTLDEQQVDVKIKNQFEDWILSPQTAIFDRISDTIQSPDIQNKVSIVFRFQRLVFIFILLIVTFRTVDQGVIQNDKNMMPAINNISGKSENRAKASIPLSSLNVLATNNSRVSNDNVSEGIATPQSQEKNSELSQAITETKFMEESVNKLKFKAQLQFAFNQPETHVLKSIPLNKSGRLISWGVILSNTTNQMEHVKQNPLRYDKMQIGYEFAAFISHPIGKFDQQYALSFLEMRQREDEYKNGKFIQSQLRVSGLKLTTFTTVSLAGRLSLGAGLSTFYPLSSIIEREEIIVNFPKTSSINFGFNLGSEFALKSKFFTHNLAFVFKYEYLFPAIKKQSSFKSFQDFSLGLKINF